jgi:hypothetical protein
MRPLGTVLCLAVLLTGCAAEQDRPSGAASTPAGCAGSGTVVARADLDGDGGAETVRRCGDVLVVEVGGDTTELDVRSRRLRAGPGQVVHLRGEPDLVLVRSRATSAGLSRPHLYGVDGRRLVEVTVDGRPLLPAVSTTRVVAPVTATCTADGGIAVVRGRASEPPGVVLAWDLTRTTYDVHAGVATRRSARVVRRSVADPVLRGERPDLFAGRLLADCG